MAGKELRCGHTSAQATHTSTLNILSMNSKCRLWATEARRMKSLSAEELDALHRMLSGLDISVEKQDEFIRILDNFATSVADQAHGMSPIQLSLTKRANYSFAGVDACATVRKSHRIERKQSHDGDAIKIPEPKEPSVS